MYHKDAHFPCASFKIQIVEIGRPMKKLLAILWRWSKMAKNWKILEIGDFDHLPGQNDPADIYYSGVELNSASYEKITSFPPPPPP